MWKVFIHCCGFHTNGSGIGTGWITSQETIVTYVLDRLVGVASADCKEPHAGQQSSASQYGTP